MKHSVLLGIGLHTDGTGQGLSVSRNVVVKGHGGELDFTTELGIGTTFHVRLPIGGMEVHDARTRDGATLKITRTRHGASAAPTGDVWCGLTQDAHPVLFPANDHKESKT